MDNFGADIGIVKDALERGILVKKDGVYVNVPGFVALVYMSQFKKFILTYGMSANDSGFVFVEDYNKEWIVA